MRELWAAVLRAKVILHAEFLAEEFLLYESIPEPEGSRYVVLERFELKDSV
jgi:2'-5' RNA ligase